MALLTSCSQHIYLLLEGVQFSLVNLETSVTGRLSKRCFGLQGCSSVQKKTAKPGPAESRDWRGFKHCLAASCADTAMFRGANFHTGH